MMMEDDNERVPHEDDDVEESEESDDTDEEDDTDDEGLFFEDFCNQLREGQVVDSDHTFWVADNRCTLKLAAALFGNTILDTLSIGISKKVTNAGVQDLARSLQTSNVSTLNVSNDVDVDLTEYETDVLSCFCEAAMKKVLSLSIQWRLCDETVTRVSRALHGDNCTLEELQLHCHLVDDPEKIDTLFDGIRKSNIIKLELEGELLFCRKMFSKGILHLPALRDVMIVSCYAGDSTRDWKVFGEMTNPDNISPSQRMSNIESLTLTLHRYFGNREMPLLPRVMGRNPNLKRLYLGHNTIGDEGVACLIRIWEEWPQLENLNLKGNLVGVAGLCQLINAASNRPSLKSLDLSWNKDIGRQGFQSIAQGMIDGFQRPSRLLELTLRGCGLNDTDMDVLAKGLHQNHNVKKLVLDANNIGDHGVASLVEGLSNGFLLEELHLVFNENIGAAGVRKLVKVTSTHHSLTALHLDRCGRIGSSDLILIAKEIKNSKLSLLEVSVKWRNRRGEMYEKASNALVGAVRCNMHLEKLSLDAIDISWRAKEAINFFLDGARDLRQLLKLDNEPPSGLWCHVMAKYGNNHSLLFYLLGEKPLLIPALERKTAKKRERRQSTATDASPRKRPPSSFVSWLFGRNLDNYTMGCWKSGYYLTVKYKKQDEVKQTLVLREFGILFYGKQYKKRDKVLVSITVVCAKLALCLKMIQTMKVYFVKIFVINCANDRWRIATIFFG